MKFENFLCLNVIIVVKNQGKSLREELKRLADVFPIELRLHSHLLANCQNATLYLRHPLPQDGKQFPHGRLLVLSQGPTPRALGVKEGQLEVPALAAEGCFPNWMDYRINATSIVTDARVCRQ